MKLFLLIFLFPLGSSRRCSKKPNNIYYQEVNAYQILSDVQAALHYKNITAFPDFLTPELAEFVVNTLKKSHLPRIPVHDILEVENVDVDHLHNVSYIGTVGKMKVNFTAVYSESKKRYLLDQEKYLVLMINDFELEKLLEPIQKDNAKIRLDFVEESIGTRNRTIFQNMLTVNAIFSTCDNNSENGETVFDEIEKIPLQFIPIVDNIEVIRVHVSGRKMNFTARIDGRGVEYMAKYSKDYSRMFLDQENCSDHYSALMNQTALAEQIAHKFIEKILIALKTLNPQRYNEVVSDLFLEHSCYGRNWRWFKDVSFFSHYPKFKRYYTIDPKNSHNVSNVVHDFTTGSLEFVVEWNKFVLNEVRVVINNGEYRIVSMKNLRCLDFSWPDKMTEEQKTYIKDMGIAAEFVTRYVRVRRSKNFEDYKELFTEPYTIDNGTQITHKDHRFCQYFDNFPNLFVVSVERDDWGLKRFRAKPQFENEGYEFEVYTTVFGVKTLESEQKIWNEKQGLSKVAHKSTIF